MRCLCACLVALAALATGETKGVYDLISENPELSEFRMLVETDSLAVAIMQQEEGTVFAPTNAAMRKYSGEKNSQLLNYHLVNLALTMSQLKEERSVPTRLTGNQPVFVAARGGSVFINNARVVTADLSAVSSQDEQSQVLHIIDEVLEPMLPNVRSSIFLNPTALQVLQNADKYDLGGASVSKFYQKVQQLERNGVFRSRSFHTYFIPIDKSFDAMADRLSGEVLDGHVIKDRALFTRTMGNDSFPTMAYSDTLKVAIKVRRLELPRPAGVAYDDSLTVVPIEDQQTPLYEVQSRTLVGDIVHQTGSVLSRIVKPNIAVKNGVIHLIERPLLPMDYTVLLFIQEGMDDRFYEFHKLLQEHAANFTVRLMTANYVTIFVPSNEAFYKVDQERLKEIVGSTEKLEKLLSLHVVRQKVTTDTVRKSAQGWVDTVPSGDPGRSLYLSVSGEDPLSRRLTVEGGGTNASVVVADIGLNNGVIHVIDRFLGIPYQTVGERLVEDPLASLTASLTERRELTKEISRTDENFTMFVPSNTAWERLRGGMPKLYDTIFSSKGSKANVDLTRVLERHLLVGEALSMAELAIKSAKEGGIRTGNSKDEADNKLKVESIPGSTDYLVKWKALQGRVVRADEECTNGYIHVIDVVLVRQEDVVMVSAAAAPAGCLALLLAATALLRL